MAEKDKEFLDSIDEEPYDQRDDMEIIEEAMAISRREWFRKHMSYIFAIIGVIVVGLIAFFIYKQFQNTNPVSGFMNSLSKDFGTSFRFDVSLTQDGKDMMHYDGTIDTDRSEQTIKALYSADYNRYTFTGALYADDKNRVKGSLYKDKWTTHDCTESVMDFFDFDADFRSGVFDSGSFLRLTGKANDYSADEMSHFMDLLKNRLSTNSSVAEITTEKTEGETRYHYTINLYELLKLADENGASVFYRSGDYDRFTETFDLNKDVLEKATCEASFVISSEGYMTSFEISIYAEGTAYGLSCSMSDFGTAKVEIPESFLKEAIVPEETQSILPVM